MTCPAPTSAHDLGPVRLYVRFDPHGHVWLCQGCADRMAEIGLALPERRDVSEMGQRRRRAFAGLRLRRAA